MVKDIDQYIKQGNDLRKIPSDRRKDFLEARRQDRRPFVIDKNEWYIYRTPGSELKRFYRQESEVPKNLLYRSNLLRVGKWRETPDAYVYIPKKPGEKLAALFDYNQAVNSEDYIKALEVKIQEKDELITRLSTQLELMIEKVKELTREAGIEA